jgi:CheY-like chemotaxis protein
MNRRALVMDDDRLIAELAALWLRHAGLDVRIAADGRAGLAVAAVWTPDVFLVDIRMPRLDGFEVMRELRNDPVLCRVPVIVLSANVQETTRHRALEAGARRFIGKPFEPADLLGAVEDALAAPAVKPGPTPSTGNDT